MEVLTLLKNPVSITKKQMLGKPVDIPISQIRTNPNQPRKAFFDESIKELSDSIKRYGVIQPIIVKHGKYSRYELIAGERRLRASKMAGLTHISAIVTDVTPLESASIALVENLQREKLNFLDEAQAYQTLIKDFALTQTQLAERIGKSQSDIANKLRILHLSPSIKKTIREKQLTERHARALLKLNKEGLQLRALRLICENGLNVKQTEDMVKQMLNSPIIPIKEEKEEKPKTEKPEPKKNIRAFSDIRIFSNTIKQAVEMMNEAGIKAEAEKTTENGYIFFKVKIPMM